MTPNDHAPDSPSATDLEAVMSSYHRMVGVLSSSRTPDFIESNLTMAQMKVLMLLGVVGEAHMSDMAGQLGVSVSTVSGLVDKLVEGGLVQRREDAADRRHVLVSMTVAGIEVIDRFQELGATRLRELLVQLDPDQLKTVRQAMDLLLAAASSAEEPK